MTINPRWGLWLSMIAAVVSALVAGGAQFTDLFGPENSKTILAFLGLANTVVNAVNAVLHAIPAQSLPAPTAAQFPLGPPPQPSH